MAYAPPDGVVHACPKWNTGKLDGAGPDERWEAPALLCGWNVVFPLIRGDGPRGRAIGEVLLGVWKTFCCAPAECAAP